MRSAKRWVSMGGMSRMHAADGRWTFVQQGPIAYAVGLAGRSIRFAAARRNEFI
jgi:hypothetical protein